MELREPGGLAWRRRGVPGLRRLEVRGRGDDEDHRAAPRARGDHGLRGAPGWVNTEFNKDFFDQYGVAAAAETIPLGEVAEPGDIANTVAFLASGLARHATGATIDLNGASYVR